MSAGGVRWEQLRALLVLRARLMIRMFAAEQGRIVGLIMILLIGLPTALGLGFGTAIGYLRMPEPGPAQLLAAVLAGLWLAWMIIPLIAFSMNEGLDITRLLVYPLSKRELVVAMLVGTLFDVPTYLMLPLFIAIVVGWIATPAVLVLAPALLIAYVHMMLSSQILVTALGAVLASRRFRDVLFVVGALVGTSCYFLQVGVQALFERFIEPQQLESLRPLLILRWTPPGSQAQVIASANNGDWGSVLLWLGYGLLFVVILAWAWWQLTERLITGGGFVLKGVRTEREERRDRSARPVRSRRTALRWLPADLQQIMAKDLRLIWRTPQRRVGLLQGLLIPVLLIGYSLVGDGLPDAIPPWVGLFLPVYGLFTAWIAGQNGLGVEEKGLPFLLLTPVSRRRLWLGKGMVTFALSLLPSVAIGLGLLYFLPAWQTAVGLLATPGIILAAIAVNHLAAIFFAYPVRSDGTQVRSNTRGGCIAGLGNSIVVPAVIGLVSAPMALVLVASQLLSAPWIGYVGSLFALAYGLAIFYGLGIAVASRLLLQREAEVLVATEPPERG